MDGYSSFHNGSTKEPDYDKLSNTIGTNIQKISQNGKIFIVLVYVLVTFNRQRHTKYEEYLG